ITKYKVFQELKNQSAIPLRFITFRHFISELYFKFATKNNIYVDNSFLISFLFHQYLKRHNIKNIDERKLQHYIDAHIEKEENFSSIHSFDSHTIEDLLETVNNETKFLSHDCKNLKDVLEIAQVYENFLSAYNLVDRKDIFKYILNYLKEKKPPLDELFKEFSFWGFSTFSTIELEIINEIIELMKGKRNFNIYLYFSNHQVLNAQINKLYRENLEQYLSCLIHSKGTYAVHKKKRSEVSPTFDKKVKILSLQDSYDEVWCCAKIIRRLLDKNTNPLDICVVIPSAEKYINLCELVFRNNLIPVNNFLKSTLSQYPLTQFILKVHKMLFSNVIEIDNLVAIISNPYYKFYNSSCFEEIQKILEDSNRPSLLYTFQDWLMYIKNSFKLEDIPNISKFFEQTNAFKEKILSHNNLTWDQFINISKKIITKFITNKNKLSKDDKLLLLRFEETISFFESLIKKISRETPQAEIYLDTIEKYFQTTHYPLSIEFSRGVNLVTYNLLSYSQFKYVFFLGLDFNEFDKGYIENPFFTDRLKLEINRIYGTFFKTKSIFFNHKTYTVLSIIENTEKSFLLYKRLELPDKNLAPSKIIYILDRITTCNISKFPAFINQGDIKDELCNKRWDLLTVNELQAIIPKQNDVVSIEKSNPPGFVKRILMAHDIFNVTDFIEIISCPKKFFYQTILKNSQKKNLTSSIFLKPEEVGTLIHKIIENIVREKKYDKKLLSLIIQSAIDNYPAFFENRPPLLSQLYQRYLEIILENPIQELFDKIQTATNLKNEEEVIGIVSLNENKDFEQVKINLKGKIDLVVEKDNKYSLVDYKSRFTVINEIKDIHIAQLVLYLRLLEGKTMKYRNNIESLCILSVPTHPLLMLKPKGKLLMTVQSQDIEKVKNEISAAIKTVLENNYFLLKVDEYGQCKYCHFKEGCGKYFKDLV
ncbi:MAG: PD-(D/E)XK nuclease family protein, partial [Planctomycetota bacterium]